MGSEDSQPCGDPFAAVCSAGPAARFEQPEESEVLVMTPFTGAEARAVILADEAFVLSYARGLSVGVTVDAEVLHAWASLVASARDRIAERGSYSRFLPARYPGGNEPDFQTLALEASAAGRAAAKARDTEAQALRTGIETILSAFGTNSAEWAQQLRALLDRVPVSGRTA